MTELQVRSAINAYEDIQKLVKEIAMNVAKVRSTKGSYTDFYFDNETVCATFEESHCGCCSPDYNEIEFPFAYLWDASFLEVETKSYEARLEAERIAKMEAAAEEDKRRREAREAKDRADYERLKKKFEA